MPGKRARRSVEKNQISEFQIGYIFNESAYQILPASRTRQFNVKALFKNILGKGRTIDAAFCCAAVFVRGVNVIDNFKE